MEQVIYQSVTDNKEKEILFSRAIIAGKRIYYLDVKKNKKEELFLTITESKKVVTGSDENASVSFEKHKIFLYHEDFDKFTEALEEVFAYIKEQATEVVSENADNKLNFKIDEFE